MSQTEAEKRAGERRKRLLKYFKEAPDPRDFTVAMTFLSVAVCIAASAAAALLLRADFRLAAQAAFAIAIIVAGTGVDKLYQYRKQFAKSHPRPSDQEMDQLLTDEITRLGSVALEKLTITPDDLDLTGIDWDPLAQLETKRPRNRPDRRRPLVVFGPDEDARAEIGRDGRWRFSDYHVMVICPTHFNLGIYVCIIDLLSGAMHGERTWEYHYDDVVAISTITVGEAEPPRLVPKDEFHFARWIHRELQIVASSDGSAKVPVVVPGHGESSAAAVEWDQIENVINSVRRVLRDRKSTSHLERV
jgi:hypothetical protein